MNTYIRFLVGEEGAMLKKKVRANDVEEALEKLKFDPFEPESVFEHKMEDCTEEEYEAWYGKGSKEAQQAIKEKVLAERRRLARWFYNTDGKQPPYDDIYDHLKGAILEITPDGEETTFANGSVSCV